MRDLALLLIRGYQRLISPRKGFRCAYRVHTGRCSCSHLGYRAIRRFGCWQGYLILRLRLQRCSIAYRRHLEQLQLASMLPAQRGDCDCGCDLPDFGNCSPADSLDCCNCDWFSRKRRKKQHAVHLPGKNQRQTPRHMQAPERASGTSAS